MKTPLLVVGSGGHARSCIDIIESTNRFQIVGLVGLRTEINKVILNHKVIGTDEDLNALYKLANHMVVAVGQLTDSQARRNIFKLGTLAGFEFPSIISPHARVSRESIIQRGCFIHHNSVINANSKVGMFSIINTGAIIEHDSTIGEFTHISTGAVVNGNVEIGSDSFIGSGAHIKQGVKIGENCLINMGVNVFKSVPDNTKILGF